MRGPLVFIAGVTDSNTLPTRPALKRVDIELTTHEFVHMQAALLTHAQTLHASDPALAVDAWAALSKLMGVPDAREVMPTRLPTREDTAMMLAECECEFELAKQRVAGRAVRS